MEAFKFVWRYLKKYKIIYAIATLLIFVQTTLMLVNPYVTEAIVDKVIFVDNRSLTLLIKLLGIMVAALLIRLVANYSFRGIFEWVSQHTLYDLRCDMYKKLQALEFDFFDKNSTGDLMAKMTGDLEFVRHFVAWIFCTTIEQSGLFIVALFVMFGIDWRFAVAQLILVPPMLFFARGLASHVKPTFDKIRDCFSKLNTVVQENIAGNRVVKAFAKENYEMEKFTDANDNYYKANIESSEVWQKYLPPLIIIGGAFSAVLILVGGYLVIKGEITMGQLVLANGLTWMLANPLNMSGWIINDWQRFFTAVRKIREIMDQAPTIKTTRKSIKPDHINGKVEFKNVWFSYDNQSTLKGISFVAYPGQTIAIIGATGSGKSTMTSLISRFYDVTGGEVLVDDINVKDMYLRTLRDNIAIAQQDIFLFSDTIEGNIAYGNPKATYEQVVEVAKVAKADGFIRETVDGYDTIIGERGVGLSGGQRQRIALARALLKNASILVLDDTTSAIDMETEREIQRTLREYYTDKTTFIIAHRISSVKNANLILVMEDGVVKESGTHQELLDLKGEYYGVYHNQLGDFDSEGGELDG